MGFELKNQEGIRKAIATADALVSDGDRTAWKNNVAEHGIGIPYIVNALKTLYLRRAYNGITGYFEVKKLVRESLGSEKDSSQGLKLFYDKLIGNGIGTHEEMGRFAYHYIYGHRIKATSEIIRAFYNSPKYIFLASTNGSTIAEAAKRIFGFYDAVSNVDLFDEGGRLKGVNLVIKNGREKLEAVHNMLAKRKIRVGNCVVMGDQGSDIPMMMAAGFSIASPFAIPEVKRIATFCIEDERILEPQELLRRARLDTEV